MPRYEYSEGASNKFWEITFSGDSFTTTFGKIGSKGQSKTKEFGSAAEAKKAGEKLVGEKIRKGYVECGSPRHEAAVNHARNPELEAAIEANPDDEEAFAVLADWLQEQGDPRGEMISLSLGNNRKKADAHFEKHQSHFLGSLAEHQVVHDEGYNNASSSLRTQAQEKVWQETQEQAFLWRHGYIHRLRLSHDVYSDGEWDGKTVDILDEVLAHPSGRFIVEFAFQSNGDPNEDDLQDLIDLLAKKAPLTTRKITFGDNIDQISWHHTGSLNKLWKGVPNLREIEIETGEFDVGKMVAPALRRAIFITGGLAPSCGKNIAKAEMPKIEHLEIYYGDPNYGGDCTIDEVRPLLARTDLERLTYLGLKNAMFANDIAKALDGAPVLRTVKTLDLSLGTMTDEGAQALVKAKKSLAHIDVIDVSESFLSDEGIKELEDAVRKVVADDQQEPDDFGDDEPYYFVSVAE